MYGVNEIKKQNANNQADLDNSRDGTYATFQDGSVLLRSIRSTKTIDDKAEAAAFLEKVRGKSTGVIKEVVLSYFQ